MKTIKQLVEQRQAKLNEAKSLLEAADKEERSLSTEEREKVEAAHAEAERLGDEIELRKKQSDAEKRGIELPEDPDPRPELRSKPGEEPEDPKPKGPAIHVREIRDYSLTRAIMAAAKGSWADAEVEARCSAQLAEVFGTAPKGFYLPRYAVLPKPIRDKVERRAKEERGIELRAAFGKGAPTTSGAALVETELATEEFIEFLRPNTVLGQAGVRFMTGLVGDVDLPRLATGSTSGWIATEGTDAAEATPVTDVVALTPKEAGAWLEITRKMQKQSAMALDPLLTDDLRTSLAVLVDKGGLEGSGASGQPTGIVNTSGVGAVTLAATMTWAMVVEFETDVETANAPMDSLRYVVNPGTKGHMKTNVKVSGTSADFLMEPDGSVNGYPSLTTTQLTGGGTSGKAVLFGNFREAIVGLWGGIDVVVDPYSLSKSGGLRVAAFQDMDIAVRHAASFSFGSH